MSLATVFYICLATLTLTLVRDGKKDSDWSKETVAEMGRCIICAYQFEVELDDITVRRMLLVLVTKCMWKH